MVTQNTQLIVKRNEVKSYKIHTQALNLPLKEEEALLKIEKFGLSANNLTYAALGNLLPYYEFFPVDAEWSGLPVWGMALVEESNSPHLEKGTRIYGYFPAADYTIVRYGDKIQSGFSVQRPKVPQSFSFYNLCNIPELDPFYVADKEDLMIVMRPVFLTGLLISDYLAYHQLMGADALLISSAASKTSYSVAASFKLNNPQKVYGLASEGSKFAAIQSGTYDQVFTYRDLQELEQVGSLAYIDVSGDFKVKEQLVALKGEKMKLLLSVGLTHWDAGNYGFANQFENIRTETFFAPGWSHKRSKEDPKSYFEQMVKGWKYLISEAEKQYTILHKKGAGELIENYQAFVEGKTNAAEGYVHSL